VVVTNVGSVRRAACGVPRFDVSSGQGQGTLEPLQVIRLV
jgi:hypothetical protein